MKTQPRQFPVLFGILALAAAAEAPAQKLAGTEVRIGLVVPVT